MTSRIRLTTAILIAPYRGNGALLAKQLASIDRLTEAGCDEIILFPCSPDIDQVELLSDTLSGRLSARSAIYLFTTDLKHQESSDIRANPQLLSAWTPPPELKYSSVLGLS
ncbi:MAG: hypothetical protein ACRDS9_19175 [Pseudonocardiaceae bacterium]